MIDKNEITKQLQDWINQMEKSGQHVDLNGINKHLGEVMQKQNTAPRDNFNGFSSEQMHFMLNFPLEARCPVRLRQLTEEQIARIPVMRQTLHLMNSLKEKEMKLTPPGLYTSQDGSRTL